MICVVAVGGLCRPFDSGYGWLFYCFTVVGLVLF